ncbi:MAG: RluA family pseudouridine synthase [Deltaproteobacteria bacterium]|nr:RluA family pseudouridine synthase [Deltaproteobacteria bacterium]
MRLDLYLVQKSSLSRHQVQKMIEEGLVKIGGSVVSKPSFKITGTEDIEYQLPVSQLPFELKPEKIPLDILYEDDQIIVINKQADLVIHPAVGHPSGTLVNALLARYGTLPAGSDPFKPGIVHRLDKGTSGVIVAARTVEALTHLQNQFKGREVEKIYWAFVCGQITEEGILDKPLGRSSKNRQKISSHTKKGKEALTEWKVLERFDGNFSWLEVKLHTGRTHQIRAHFTEAGNPLIGDPTYGRMGKKLKDQITRPALHARSLRLTHPKTGKRVFFEAPMPEDLQKLLSYLKG